MNMVVLGMRITNKRRPKLLAAASQLLLGIAGLALITFVCFQLDFGVGRTAFAYLILVVPLSLLGSVSASVVLSIIATACLNFFFAPPLFEFRIDSEDDAVRIAMFLITSLVVTVLTTKRRRAEQELGEINARLEEAQRIAHVGWWERDLITDRVTVSDEAGLILGKRPVAPWLELIHPEDRARVADAAAAAVRPGGPRYDVEYRVLRPDGALRVIHSRGEVTWDDSGRPLRKFGVLQDITELRRAERALRASEVRFRTLVDHASDAFFLYNEDATVLDVNRQACENLGYRRDELIGMTAFDYGPDLTPALLQRIRERLRGGKIVSYDGRHRRKDGTVFPVEIRMRELWHEGQLLAVSLDRDITERKWAEDALRASEERFRTLFQFSFEVYWETDTQHRFTRLEYAQGLVEAPASGAEIGKRPWELRNFEADAEAWRKHREALEAHLPFRDFEVARRTPDGSKRHMSVSGLPVFDESGGFVGYRGAGRDITERKTAEEALRRSEAYLAGAQELSHSAAFAHNLKENLYWSEGLYRIWGFDPSRGIPSREACFQRIHPDDRDRVQRVAGEAIRQKQDYTIEYRIILPDGTLKHLRSICHPSYSLAGELVEVVGTSLDETERKRAEDKLRASEERFRTLVQFSFDVYWESDAEHRFIRQEFAEGLTDAPAPGSEIGKTRWEVPYLEPDAEAWRKHRETLDAHLPFRDFEIARPAPDGGKRYVSTSGLPVFDKSGSFIGYRGVGRHITERKKAESELRDSQKKLEGAQRIAHVGWWERDFITNRVSLSDEVGRTFGVQPVDLPEWDGRWLDLIHPDDRARAAEAKEGALRGDRRYDLEYRVVRPDGSIRIVHSQGDVTWDESGRPVRQFGVLQDITELRQTESELRASEARFRTFVDHATDAFYLHDDQGIILDVNRQACEGLGYSREELIGMDPRAFDVGLDAPGLALVIEQVRSGQMISYETLHRRKNGDVFPVEIRIRRFQHGNALFGLGLARDITDRKRAEQRLVAQHRVAQLLANAASIEEAAPRVLQALCECLNWDMSALWRIDNRAGVLRCEQLWHKPALEATQFEAATRASTFECGIGLPGKVWASRAAACIADVADDPGFLRATVAAREGFHAAFAFPILLGGEVIGVIDFVNREIRVPDEELIHAMATIGSQIGQFIERKRAENALLVAQAEIAHISRLTTMGELTASIAHEINQPLTGVVSSGNACLRYLADNVSDIEAARRAVERIIRDAMRANEVIKRIRALATKSPAKRVRLDIHEVVIETVSLVRPEFQRQNISLRTELAKGLAPVIGDQIELQQVLLNLIMNAKEAMSAVDDHLLEMTIRTEQIAPNEVLVSVRDTGPGVDEAELDRMFEAFHTTKSTGMGMGLAISRSIIEAHRGRLWAKPNQPRGAVFQFTVPVWQEEKQ